MDPIPLTEELFKKLDHTALKHSCCLLYTSALGCAVRVQPGYHADLACLLVTDYQHVLFVVFLCHLKNVLMGYL